MPEYLSNYIGSAVENTKVYIFSKQKRFRADDDESASRIAIDKIREVVKNLPGSTAYLDSILEIRDISL